MRPRSLGWVVAGFALSYLPWMAYQKFYDPPGDRLLKMHLAGVASPDPRPFLLVLRSAYSHLTFSQIAQARLANLITIIDHQRAYWSAYPLLALSATRQQAAHTLRDEQFFFFFPALGFYAIGFPLLLAGALRCYRTELWKRAVFCWLMVVAALLCWCALLFRANAAVIHQGSYAVMLVAIVGCVISLWSFSPMLGRTLVLAQATMTLLLYAVFSSGTWQPFQMMNILIGVLLLATTLRWITMTQDESC